MNKIKAILQDQQGDELFAVWQEYEEQKTYESKFVKALDKLEAFIQHNELPLDTWKQIEKEMLFQDRYLKPIVSLIASLKNLLNM